MKRSEAGVGEGRLSARRVAVITFDEPEFEPSFVNTQNEGKSIFAWLFFTGRCRFSHLSLRPLRRGNLVRGSAYLCAGVVFALRSLVFRSETGFEALSRVGARATFFGIFSLIADAASRQTYLPVFRAILAEGHDLGLHGYHHGPLSQADLDLCQALAREHLGLELTTYSSPFGDDRLETLQLLERAGFIGMRIWDAAFLEYESPVRRFTYGFRLEQALASGAPVLVLNLHSGDCYPWGFRRVKRIIAALKRRGYQFMTFEELCRTYPQTAGAEPA